MEKQASNYTTPYPYESMRKKSRGLQFVFWLLIAGLSMIFFTLLVGVIYNWVDNGFPNIEIPLLFYGSTLLLVLTSYLVERAWNLFKAIEPMGLLAMIWLALLTGLLFVAGQAGGWYYMFEHLNIGMKQASGAFLYLLSGVHLVHVFLILPFQIAFSFDVQTNDHPQDEYLKRPDRRLRMRLIRDYWHFLGLVWSILFIALLVMQFISAFIV